MMRAKRRIMPPPTRHRIDRHDWLLAAAIFAAALTVRLVFLLTSPDRSWPHSIFYEGDAPTWVAWANALDRGEPFEFNLPLRAPGGAYVLSWIHPGVINSSLTPHKVFWCVLTSFAAVLMYLAIRLRFTRPVALIATGLYVFSFGSYIVSTSLNNEALYTFMLMAMVLGTLRLVERPSVSLAALLGVFHGVAMLIRFEHQLLLGFSAFYLAWHLCRPPQFRLHVAPPGGAPVRGSARLALATIGTVISVAIAVCLPWSIRGSLATRQFNTASPDVPNFAHAQPKWSAEAQAFLNSLPAFARDGNFQFINHLAAIQGQTEIHKADVIAFFTQHFNSIPEPLSEWTFLSLKGPVDFALANHPDAGGGFSKAALAQPGETDPTISFGRPDHLRLFNYGYSVGWNYIASDFGGWLRRVGVKLSNFYDGAAFGFTSRNLPVGLNGERRPVDVFSHADGHWWRFVVLALILGGAWRCIVRQEAGFWLLILIYKLAVVVLFYGYARQAVSILPAFFLLMALAIDQMATFAASIWRPSHRVTAGVIAILIGAALVLDISGSWQRPYLTISGPVRFTPPWGDEAFESHHLIRIAPGESAPRN